MGIFAPDAVVYNAFIQLRTVFLFRKRMTELLHKDSEKEPKQNNVVKRSEISEGDQVLQSESDGIEEEQVFEGNDFSIKHPLKVR